MPQEANGRASAGLALVPPLPILHASMYMHASVLGTFSQHHERKAVTPSRTHLCSFLSFGMLHSLPQAGDLKRHDESRSEAFRVAYPSLWSRSVLDDEGDDFLEGVFHFSYAEGDHVT